MNTKIFMMIFTRHCWELKALHMPRSGVHLQSISNTNHWILHPSQKRIAWSPGSENKLWTLPSLILRPIKICLNLKKESKIYSSGTNIFFFLKKQNSFKKGNM